MRSKVATGAHHRADRTEYEQDHEEQMPERGDRRGKDRFSEKKAQERDRERGAGASGKNSDHRDPTAAERSGSPEPSRRCACC